MTGRRITGFLLAIAGAAGFTACLKSVLAGFRDVIKVDGGSALARTGAWLFATVAGLGLGIALSSALITALR
jgi:protein-S-isoprenylcysteine O-methyltransferase Ste14